MRPNQIVSPNLSRCYARGKTLMHSRRREESLRRWRMEVATVCQRVSRMRMEAVGILEVVTEVCETLGSSRMGAGFLSVVRWAWYGLDGLIGMGLTLRRSLRGRVASGSARSCLLPVRNCDILSHLFLLGHPGLLRPARTAEVCGSSLLPSTLGVQRSMFLRRPWRFGIGRGLCWLEDLLYCQLNTFN